MKVFYSICASFATVVVGIVASTLGPAQMILSGIATMGGFICYAILKSKE